VQWSVVPLMGIGLGRAFGAGVVGDGAVICGAVPAEITSALVAVLAAGSGELAISTMAASLALGTVLTPLWIGAGLGTSAHVDRAALIAELALAVALPLAVSVVVRSRVPAIARQAPRCLDLAALSVVLVVFVAAGSARDIVASLSLLGALGVCAALQAVGYGAGLGLARSLRLRRPEARALVFPIGMREFGIATAVALSVAPASAAVAGIYGIMVMVTGPALAMWLRVGRRGRPAPGPLLHSAPR
jgi:BASS family bile acid:Na+ symporter